jgi:hypothetical protein
VANQTFLAVEKIEGDFNANGIIGLAPEDNANSIVKTMKNQGVISKAMVALNFENVSGQSSVSFGSTDFSQVVDGADGMNTFSNVGFNEWAVLVDHVKYGDIHAFDDEDK